MKIRKGSNSMKKAEERDQELINKAKNSGIILSYQDDDNNDTYENNDEADSVDTRNKDVSKETQAESNSNEEATEAKPKVAIENDKNSKATDTGTDVDLNNVNLDDGNCEQIVKIVDDSQNLTRFKTIKGNENMPVLPKLKYLAERRKQENYKLVSELPTDLLFNQDNSRIAELHFEHQTENVKRTKTVTETVEYATSDDSKAPDKVVQKLEFTQPGTKDLVTGLTSWAHDELIKTFPEVKTPEIKGYSADPEAIKPIKIVIDNDNFNDTLDVLKLVNYLPDRQTIIVKFVDEIEGKEIDAAKKLTGFTNRSPQFNAHQLVKYYEGKGYTLSYYPDELDHLVFKPEQQEFTIKFKHQLMDISLDNPLNPRTGEDLSDKLTKTVTRTIVFEGKHLKHDSVQQKAVFKRTAKFDAITGEVHYDPYNTGLKWNEYSAPDISGYKALTQQVSERSVEVTDKDIISTLQYEPLSLSIEFIFFDEQDNKKLYSTSETGDTGDQCNFDYQPFIDKILANHYKLVDNPLKDNTIVFDPAIDDQHYTITFKHQTRQINLDNPINTVTGDNEADHLRHTVIRSIKFSGPYGVELPHDVEQSATFKRDGELDLVTGNIHYNPYKDVKTGQAKATFDAINIPVIKGYTADTGDLVYDGTDTNDNTIEAIIVTGESNNINVEVNYEAQFQKISFVFFDKRSRTILGRETFKGKTATPIDFDLDALVKVIESKGYKVDPYHFKLKAYPNENKAFRLNFDHQFKDIDSSNPDKGILLEKSYDYTIIFVDKNDTPIQNNFVLKQRLVRKATKDLALNKVLYTDWTKANKLPRHIKLTPLKGLIPTTPKIIIPDLLAAKRNLSYHVTYLAPLQTIKIDYICDEKPVKTFNLDFKLKQNQAIKLEELTSQVEKMGYILDPSQPTDNELAIPHILEYDRDLSDTRHYKIPVREEYDQSLESKHVKRSIVITNPNKSRRIVTEDAIVTRVIKIGKASGTHKYGEWSKNIWDKFEPQSIKGFIASPTHIPETIVDGNTDDSTIQIDYTELPHVAEQKPEHEELPDSAPRNDEEKPKLGFFSWLRTKFNHKEKEELIPDALPEPKMNKQKIHVQTTK